MIAAFLTLALVSFALHVTWERLHIGLYTGYEKMEGRLPVFVFATAGDVAYAFLAVLVAALFKGSLLWFLQASALDYVGLALLGFFMAVFVEYKAMALRRWEYTDRMPRIFGLGLTPLIQMTVLLPLSVFITAVIGKVL